MAVDDDSGTTNDKCCTAGRSAEVNNNNNNTLVEANEDDYCFDWGKIVHEAETVEDDSSDFDMEEHDEEDPADDDLKEYVIELKEDWDEVHNAVEILPHPQGSFSSQNNELSEDSKALLVWSVDESAKFFSDWKIKVEADKSDSDDSRGREESVTVYNVHRVTLTTGPKQSGYFQTLLQSDCYRESIDCMSTVKLPEMVATQFPAFLDYMYAPLQESNTVINFENWESMQFLADYFLVPRLTESVAEFIEVDIECFNPDHMVKYITEFHRDIDSDMSRRILPKAVLTCAKMLRSIEPNSTLLKSIPPAMYYSIMTRGYTPQVPNPENHPESQQAVFLHRYDLHISYFDQVVDDIEVFGFLCSRIHFQMDFLYHFNDASDDRILQVLLPLFQVMTKKGWDKYDEYAEFSFRIEIWRFEDDLGHILDVYLRSKYLNSETMERIVRHTSCRIIARLFDRTLFRYQHEAEEERRWNLRYNELISFQDANGHSDPHGYPLGDWVSYQRKLYAQNRLKEEYVNKLNSIEGFEWTATDL